MLTKTSEGGNDEPSGESEEKPADESNAEEGYIAAGLDWGKIDHIKPKTIWSTLVCFSFSSKWKRKNKNIFFNQLYMKYQI